MTFGRGPREGDKAEPGQLNWRLRAACRDSEPELFFPEGTRGPALAAMTEAKRICAGCPVRARCLDWALRHNALFGVWGGRTEEERRAARARFSPARVTTGRNPEGARS